MSAWASATIEQFEQVSLENETELFRVGARGRVGDEPDPRPVLDCGPPDDVHSYEPLSSGGDRRGLLRLAYAVPSGLVGPSATFALRLPDGSRIELPRPTPGRSRADAARGRRVDDVPEPSPQPGFEPAAEDDDSQPIGELEQGRERLQRRLSEITGAHEAVRSERDEALRRSGAAQAERDEARREAASVRAQRDAALGEVEVAGARRDEALREAEAARAERDAALQTADEAAETARSASAERDAVLETTAGARAEHERLMRRLRQHEARFELLRADAQRIEAALGPGATVRLRRLQAEHEQIAGHVRALNELVAAEGRAADRHPTANGASERVAAARDRALRAAHEQAERDLEQMLADADR